VLFGGIAGVGQLQSQGAPADVVLASLEHRDPGPRPEADTLQESACERHFLLHGLFLKSARVGGHTHPDLLTEGPQQGRHEVGQGLARAGRCVHEEELVLSEPTRDLRGQLVLSHPIRPRVAALGEVAGQMLLEDLVDEPAIRGVQRDWVGPDDAEGLVSALLRLFLPARVRSIQGELERVVGPQGVAEPSVGQRLVFGVERASDPTPDGGVLAQAQEEGQLRGRLGPGLA